LLVNGAAVVWVEIVAAGIYPVAMTR
jgi:hypothetical protein